VEALILSIAGGLVLVLGGYAFWQDRRRVARYHARLRDAAWIGTGHVLVVDVHQQAESSLVETLTLDIEVAGQPRRQARVYHHCVGGLEPKVGDAIPLRIHPDHPEDIYLET
jgi:hypothetical protein